MAYSKPTPARPTTVELRRARSPRPGDWSSENAAFPAFWDERGHRVAFLAHCLLNQNTRYPGGAVRPGAIPDVVEPLLRDGIGICQLPCPEQLVWGGVRKRHIVRFWGHPRALTLAKIGLNPFLYYTRLRYRKLARSTAASIADYLSSGSEVVAVVGVSGSPSCGVTNTLTMGSALDRIVGCPMERLNAQFVNDALAYAQRPGKGLFIEEVARALQRRQITVPITQYRLKRSTSPAAW